MMAKTAILLSLAVLFCASQNASAEDGTSFINRIFVDRSSSEDADFLKAKEIALADKDPWHAWQQLSDNAPKDLSGNAREKYSELAASLVLKAARNDNPEALVLVFDKDNAPGFVAGRAELYKPLLVLAEQSSGSKKDRKLLMAAADILQAGRWTIKDSQRAAGFYARAWLAGEAAAPSYLYDVFKELRDPGSAYLWQIRCIGDCGIYEDKNAMSQFLTPRQIQWIQTLAHNKTVITVNGLAARKELQ